MKKIIQQLRKDERGLTLVELLAVVVILGIIATIAFVSIGNVIENSREDAHVSNAMQAIAAAKLSEASSSDGWSAGVVYTTDKSAADASTDGKIRHLDTLETLTNPWKTDDSTGYIAEVSKEGENYVVTIKGTTTNQLTIKNALESEVIKGRDATLVRGE